MAALSQAEQDLSVAASLMSESVTAVGSAVAAGSAVSGACLVHWTSWHSKERTWSPPVTPVCRKLF